MAIERFPGFIDTHVHLRQMNNDLTQENFVTGTEAAAAGGSTLVVDMPNDKKPTVTFETLEEKIDLANKLPIRVDLGFNYGTTNDTPPTFRSVQDLAVTEKVFLDESTQKLWIVDPEQLERILEEFPIDCGRPLYFHAEEPTGSLAVALDKSAKYSLPIHIGHLSTRRGLEMVQEAKKSHLLVTCEVTPHHLELTKVPYEDGLGPFGRMRPPLATIQDVEYLLANLNDIDTIATDHAPHTRRSKIDTDSIVNGVPGLDTLGAFVGTLINEGLLSKDRAIEMTNINPRRIFKLPDQGEDTYTMIDMDLVNYHDIEG